MSIIQQLATTLKPTNLPIPKTLAVKMEKHAPTIMIVGGTALIIGAAIYACKKSIRAHEAIEEANEKLDKINEGVELAGGSPDFDEKVARKERAKVYTDLGLELGKCYGPSVIAGIIGFGLIFKSNAIMKERNKALALSYANLLASYKNYRDRVRQEYGEEADIKIASNGEVKEITYVDENGETQVKKANVIGRNGVVYSPYARCFGEGNDNWSISPNANISFLRGQELWANDKFRTEGILFLNDVYRALGFPRTPDGQVVGWVWDPNIDALENYISFGIFENVVDNREIRDFVNGVTDAVWLDFNVDGVVHELL